VLRTFVCECRPKATPKASLQQLKKNAHGSDQKQNRLEKYSLVVLLLPTAIFATLDPFFFNRFRSAFVMSFVRHSADFFIWLPLRSADESGWP
jgi:hypothetical protein